MTSRVRSQNPLGRSKSLFRNFYGNENRVSFA
jgi:hypothetical protein